MATVEPDAEGSRLPSAVTSARTAAASAPTAASSGAAMPSPWARSAPSRCVGPTSGLPASEAACTAAEIACWVLVVGLKLSIPASSCIGKLWGRNGPSTGTTSEKLSLFRSGYAGPSE